MSYTKHTWVNGEILDADKMNHLEDGVVAVSANGAIGTANLADNAVTSAKIADGAVTTDKIAAKSVTRAKLSDAVTAELDNKANIDGSYESMTVGNAEQIVSSVGIEDQTPYNFRTSGGSTEIGDREELNAVVGVSVPWNQLVQNGDFSSNTNWSWRLSGGGSIENNEGKLVAVNTSANNQMFQSITLPANRKFLVTFSARKGADNSFSWLKVSLARSNALNVTKEVTLGTSKADYAVIMTHTDSSGNLRFSLSASSLSVGDTAYISNVNIFDLTLTLGSTIADYIYSLEQSNAGAGVAYFRKLFPKPYYAYNSGKLLSVQTSAHKMVGFNQWDEQWENGRFNITTGAASTGNGLRNKNMIRVIPNTVYHAVFGNYSQGVVILFYYDANGGFLSYEAKYSADFNFTTPDSACYLNFNLQTSSAVTAYHNDICIDISWDGERNGEYMPYVEHVYPLDSSLTLRGILKLDASNNLYADGDRYLPDGTVTRKRRQIVADGDTVKVMEVNQSNGTYWCRLTTLSSANKGVNSTTTETRIITDKGYRDYPVVGVGHIYITNNGIAPIICLFDQTLTTVSAVNTYLASNPITIEYELETPTTETASPYQQTQIVDDFGTEEFVDAAVEANERDVAIPVGNETVYKPNLRAKLEMAPDSPDGDGDYIVRQTNGQNTYIPLVDVKELPDFPSNDGLYKLRCTVTNGTATLSWASDS